MSAPNSPMYLERAILHTAFQRPSSLVDIALGEHHFASETHAMLWALIQRLTLAGKSVDAVSVADLADRDGRNALGQLAIEIASDYSLIAYTDPRHQVEQVLHAWRSREAVSIARTLATAAANREDGALDIAIASLMALHAGERQSEFTAATAMKAAFGEIERAYSAGGALIGVPSGLIDLDTVLGGLHDADLIVVGARPAMGKTGLLLQMIDAASQSMPVGLISGEQPAEQVGLRWMAGTAMVSVGRLRNAQIEDHEWARVSDTVAQWAQRPVWILDRSAPDVADVARMARRWKQQHGIRALYVDYLQRLEFKAAGDAPKHERIGAIARALKNLARDLNIPVIVLAQVSRQVEQRQNQRPMMSDLSDSSEIEKEADQVMMLWRDLSDPSARVQPAEINVVKNRHGNIGKVSCEWHGEQTRFVGADGRQAPQSTNRPREYRRAAGGDA